MVKPALNAAEAFVQQLCHQTFLSVWCIANPRGKEAGKELCDLLVVCDPDVIIISVKDVEYKQTPEEKTGMDRWTARAVKSSIDQIYGAERALRRMDRVIGRDGTTWLPLPPSERIRLHRLAVAFGSKDEIPIADGDAGKGFVHVLDERALVTLMTELNTVTDFVDFLRRTEVFLEKTQVVTPGLEQLLALYLHRGRAYPEGHDLLILSEDMWSGLSARDEFRRRKEADEASYFWDALIQMIAADHDPDLTETHGVTGDAHSPVESVVRLMAREDRFARRLLAKGFQEFHKGGGVRARLLQSPSGVVYVFLVRPHGYDRTARRNELLARMFIARGMHKNASNVVGIATEEYDPGKGFSLDSAAFIKPDWTDEDELRMQELKNTTGAFAEPTYSRIREDEYPRQPGDA